MTNPLKNGDSAGGGEIPPGATRIITARDKQGNVLKTMTLHRTNRPYVYDLRDCYNEYRTREAVDRGVEWYVNRAGDLRIGMAVADPAVRALHHEQ